MRIGQDFAIAIHILLGIAYFKDEKITSEFIAASVGVNPVVVRKIAGLLKSAGLIETKIGTGGMSLAKAPENIDLRAVYKAIFADEKIFKIHANAPKACPLGGKIETLLSGKFHDAQIAMENEFLKTSLKNLLDDLEKI